MATYAEVLAALEKTEGGPAFVEVIQAEVSKKNSEAMGLRKRLKPLETKVRALVGAEESDDLDEVFEKIEQTVKAGGKAGKPDDRVATLEKTLAKLTAELTTERAQKTAAIVGGKLKDALGKHNAVRPDDLVRLLADAVKIEGDKAMFVSEDGTELDIESGVGAWLKARPELVRSTQQPGPGGAGTKHQTPGGQKTITRAEYQRAQQEREIATLNGVGSGTIKIVD